MSSARVDSAGTVTQLGPRVVQQETFTAEDAEDPEKVARAINDLRAKETKRSSDWRPREMEFEDIVVTGDGVTKTPLAHGFGGRVRYWIVDVAPGSGGAPDLERHADTDDNTLVLISWVNPATITILVREAG